MGIEAGAIEGAAHVAGFATEQIKQEELLNQAKILEYGLESVADMQVEAHGTLYTVREAISACPPFTQMIEAMTANLKDLPNRSEIITNTVKTMAAKTTQIPVEKAETKHEPQVAQARPEKIIETTAKEVAAPVWIVDAPDQRRQVAAEQVRRAIEALNQDPVNSAKVEVNKPVKGAVELTKLKSETTTARPQPIETQTTVVEKTAKRPNQSKAGPQPSRPATVGPPKIARIKTATPTVKQILTPPKLVIEASILLPEPARPSSFSEVALHPEPSDVALLEDEPSESSELVFDQFELTEMVVDPLNLEAESELLAAWQETFTEDTLPIEAPQLEASSVISEVFVEYLAPLDDVEGQMVIDSVETLVEAIRLSTILTELGEDDQEHLRQLIEELCGQLFDVLGIEYDVSELETTGLALLTGSFYGEVRPQLPAGENHFEEGTHEYKIGQLVNLLLKLTEPNATPLTWLGRLALRLRQTTPTAVLRLAGS